MMFFGERWDAPVCDPPAKQIPTPVGERCYRCNEAIIAGDQGHLFGSVAADESLGTTAVHRECFLLDVVGHMVKVCSCTGWDTTSRAAAREAIARVEAGWLVADEMERDLGPVSEEELAALRKRWPRD